jgi:hypothetical protein
MLENVPHFHAIKDGSLRMILDSNSSNMEESNVIEWKQAMNFYTSIAIVPNISKGVCRQILGQVMDLNYFTRVLNLVLVEPFGIYFSHPSTLHLHLLHR